MNESVAEPEVLDSQATELEMLDHQNVELEVLAAYDNMDDLSDINNLDDDEGLFVGKTFENWDQVANFMKKYAAAKGHGIRIGGSGRVNAENQKVVKRTYLCYHAGKPAEKLTFNNQHVGHELNPLASCFDPMLQKLPKDIVEEIHFLTVIAKANATMQYRIIQEKYKVRIYRPDLYNTIQMFWRDSVPGKDDAEMLLKRLNEKKIEDPRWAVSIEFDPVTSSLTHLFWMSPE
ncbi:21899_t:CDS:2 [Cetraspora pellucida]|uniref:21899_t:CDS:1 n=1 Tax=Cetraspora pellucida TaxID=1433469 RepID=A0A9N9IAV0_9GLOM|nr:21899_t:CDS:2 [Cetraspora pellucida]